jgi:hypothetical protein
MSIAQRLANALHRFNAKERNFLMRFALLGEVDSGPPTQSTNWVNSNFFLKLKSALEVEPAQGDPSGPVKLSAAAHCVYAAMDYHLDWLHAALCDVGSFSPIKSNLVDPVHQRCWGHESTRRFVVGTPEDIDLLVLIEDASCTLLVLIEAKGVASFSPKQFISKLTRLNGILGQEHVPKDQGLRFVLVLLAPDEQAFKTVTVTTKIAVMADSGDAPRLERNVRFMQMPNFPQQLDRVTRCDQYGKNDPGSSHESRKSQLTHWKAVPR